MFAVTVEVCETALLSDQIMLASTPDAPAEVANCTILVDGVAAAFKYFLVAAFTAVSAGIVTDTESSPGLLAVATNPPAVASILYVEDDPAPIVS